MKYVVAGALALAAVVGCGDTIHIHEAPDGGSESVETGGVNATGGMEMLTGGVEETGGDSLPTGGTVEPDSGGMEATGGAVEESGGSVETGGAIETGGAQMTGGEVAETGGTVVETGGVAPCSDDDSDGVCNDVDVCPAGSDADEDGNGFADACDTVLWSADVGGESWHQNGNADYTATVVLSVDSERHEFANGPFAPVTSFTAGSTVATSDIPVTFLNASGTVVAVAVRVDEDWSSFHNEASYHTTAWVTVPTMKEHAVTRHAYRVTYDFEVGEISATWEIRGY